MQSEAAPAAYNEYYDPNDPNADWSGFVAKPQRRHIPSTTPSAMKVQFQSTESGFMMPSEGAKTSDWHRPGKKTASPDQNSNPNSTVKKNQMSTTPNLLGGIGTYNR